MSARMIKSKVKVMPPGLNRELMKRNNPNYMIQDISLEVLDKQVEGLVSQVFDKYHTKGKDDSTFIKKEYNTDRDVDIPSIIRDIIEHSKTLCKMPPKDPEIVVKCYLYTKNTKTKIDIPSKNTAMRLFYNYNHDSKFYLDPEYEDVNMDGIKVILRSDSQPSYVTMKKNTTFIMGPAYRYEYTIRDMESDKGSRKDHSMITRPRISSYQRLNVTVDFILKEEMIRKLEAMSKDAISSVKLDAKAGNIDMKKHIELLTKKNPELKSLSEEVAKIMKGESKEDDEVIKEMKKVKEDKGNEESKEDKEVKGVKGTDEIKEVKGNEEIKEVKREEEYKEIKETEDDVLEEMKHSKGQLH
jgi:hypothetical protein